jgi:hypothetical protein
MLVLSPVVSGLSFLLAYSARSWLGPVLGTLGVGVWKPADQTFASQAAQVVGHLRRAVAGGSRPATWARRLRLVNPATALMAMHRAPTRAIVRGSPKRKAPVRWPSSSEGSEIRSNRAVETAQPWPAR